MALFGENPDIAKKNYRDFVESVQHERIKNPSEDLVNGAILGGADFINWVKKAFLTKESDSRELPRLKSLKPRPTPDDLIQVLCNEFGCRSETILPEIPHGPYSGIST